MASHELKTPLTTTKLNLEVLKKMLGSDADRVGHVLVSLDRQALRQDKLVNNIVDVTLIESGQLPFKMEEIEIKRYVEKGANSAHYSIYKGNIELSCESVTGIWDGRRIEQVVYSLVHNAIKYGDQSPVKVILVKENGNAVIEIKNTGSREFISDPNKIFLKFGGKKKSEPLQGLGTGLYIANHIVARHGGTLDLKADENGTAFKVILPIRLDPR